MYAIFSFCQPNNALRVKPFEKMGSSRINVNLSCLVYIPKGCGHLAGDFNHRKDKLTITVYMTADILQAMHPLRVQLLRCRTFPLIPDLS
jgi:hypothetical protein